MSEKKPDLKNIAVFLDRDGTINEDSGYVSRPEDVVLIKGAVEAVRALNSLGVPVIVITNQSGVGRGYFTEDSLKAVNTRLIELLNVGGARIDGLYCCVHRPDDKCGCRKPKTGLIVKAASVLGIDPRLSYVIGDKASDAGLARNVGARAVMVRTGHGRKDVKTLLDAPDFVADDIVSAVEWVIEDLRLRQGRSRTTL
ncbi:MAG: HAD family hydrolase [Deltaproteobacteria bacterium]|nr:HAD family hydrolase [Deltaproteobacteria bacterium]